MFMLISSIFATTPNDQQPISTTSFYSSLQMVVNNSGRRYPALYKQNGVVYEIAHASIGSNGARRGTIVVSVADTQENILECQIRDGEKDVDECCRNFQVVVYNRDHVDHI